MYTLMVASMGRDVVAVDAMADNLAYIRTSLKLGNNEDRVVLVHNPIRYSLVDIQIKHRSFLCT